mgnify:CR=1 FL=1
MITVVTYINLCGETNIIHSIIDIDVVKKFSRFTGWPVNHLIEAFASHECLKDRIFKCILMHETTLSSFHSLKCLLNDCVFWCIGISLMFSLCSSLAQEIYLSSHA